MSLADYSPLPIVHHVLGVVVFLEWRIAKGTPSYYVLLVGKTTLPMLAQIFCSLWWHWPCIDSSIWSFRWVKQMGRQFKELYYHQFLPSIHIMSWEMLCLYIIPINLISHQPNVEVKGQAMLSIWKPVKEDILVLKFLECDECNLKQPHKLTHHCAW